MGKRRAQQVGISTIAFLIAVIFFSGQVYAETKIAYADLAMIFEGYKKTKDYDTELEGIQKAKQKEIDSRVEEIKKLQDKLSLLSDKEKDAKKSEIEAKTKLLQEFQANSEMDLRKSRDERLKEILKDIQSTVEQIAKAEGYDFVLNDKVLLYGAKTADISQKVLDTLNANYKAPQNQKK